ncbi:MAG: pseudoazurin [Devosiaceae bacterium]|nr:pseudoazurin [Devosiaceae bacterium MH13]
MPLSINRRTFVISTGAIAAASAISTSLVRAETTHEVQMLNVHPDNPRLRNVFEPRILVVQPGDTVSFVSVNPSHNSASTEGMIPEGAEPWSSQISQGIDVTLTVPGYYGYQCTPHLGLGMVGLVLVEGEGQADNLEAARSVRQRGMASRVWDEIWAEAEEQGLLG